MRAFSRLASLHLSANNDDQLFKAGDIIINEGDEGGDLLIIREGTVQVYKTKDDKRLRLGTLGPGELLGSMTCVSGGHRTASVKAVTDVRVSVIKHAAVQKLVAQAPSWTLALINDLVKRLDTVDALMVDLSFADVNHLEGHVAMGEQVARSLAQVARIHVKAGGPNTIVRIDELMPEVVELTKLPEKDVEAIVQIFRDGGFFEKLKSEKSTAILGRLEEFASFVGNPENQDQFDRFQSLNPKEREALEALVDFSQFLEVAPDEPATIRVRDFIQFSSKKNGDEISFAGIEKADKIDILDWDRHEDPPALKFVPSKLQLQLQMINAIVALTKCDEKDNKGSSRMRTVVY